jgi:hypothetical protein
MLKALAKIGFPTLFCNEGGRQLYVKLPEILKQKKIRVLHVAPLKDATPEVKKAIKEFKSTPDYYPNYISRDYPQDPKYFGICDSVVVDGKRFLIFFKGNTDTGSTRIMAVAH